jgi:hypothetical protein
MNQSAGYTDSTSAFTTICTGAEGALCMPEDAIGMTAQHFQGDAATTATTAHGGPHVRSANAAMERLLTPLTGPCIYKFLHCVRI